MTSIIVVMITAPIAFLLGMAAGAAALAKGFMMAVKADAVRSAVAARSAATDAPPAFSPTELTPAQMEAHNLAMALPAYLCPRVANYPDGGAILDIKPGGPDDPGGEGLWFNVDRPDQWEEHWRWAFGLTAVGRGGGEA